MRFSFYQPECIYELGRRENQEDALFPSVGIASPSSRLFVVCDGMGGHESGEVASRVVCQSISREMLIRCHADKVCSDDDFNQALSIAYDELDKADLGGDKKMGTTLALLCFHRGGCIAAHIGDSRIYHFRPSTGEILYRSRDHSLVNQMYETGEITRHEMLTSKKKNLLLRALQPHQPQRTVADIIHITDIRPDDYFFVCTDGILERLDDGDFMNLFSEPTSDAEKLQTLKQLTEHNSDNHSCYFVRVKNVEVEEADDQLPNDEPAARANCRALNDTTPDVEVTVQEVEDVDDDDEVRTAETMFLESGNDVRDLLESDDEKRQPLLTWSRVLMFLLIIAALLLIVLKMLNKFPF